MKALCICQYGHSRSAALAQVFHHLGHAAVAIGVGTSGDAVFPLAEWADRIFVLQPAYANHVPSKFASKVRVFDVGPDIWSNPYSQDLQFILTKMAYEHFTAEELAK